MQILTVDIGTGTQDILLFETDRSPENCLQLVMPSPTLLVAQQVRQATAAGLPLLISGRIMGGGPSSWAVEAHRRAGLRVVATFDAARTFDDDLDRVAREMGVELVDTEEACRMVADVGFAHVEFGDFRFEPIRQAFAAFGCHLQPDAVALAVFDHGAAPPGVSDRQFRMDYLIERLQRDRRLSSLAFWAGEAPPVMTRLQAVGEAASEQTGAPVVVMDTAPAAVLGAFDDPVVAAHPDALVANVGNFHTLAFQYRGGEFVRLFEHHTGLLDGPGLAGWLRALADGSISHAAVFAAQGHGALSLSSEPVPLEFVAVTGPRRALAVSAGLPVHYAVPHGAQMMAGCFGLLRACADLEPAWRAPLEELLSGVVDRSLW